MIHSTQLPLALSRQQECCIRPKLSLCTLPFQALRSLALGSEKNHRNLMQTLLNWTYYRMKILTNTRSGGKFTKIKSHLIQFFLIFYFFFFHRRPSEHPSPASESAIANGVYTTEKTEESGLRR